MARARLRIVTVRDEDILNSEPPDSKAVPVASASATPEQRASATTPPTTFPSNKSLSSEPTPSVRRKSATKAAASKASANKPAQLASAKAVTTKSTTALKRATPASPSSQPLAVASFMRREVITCSPGASLSSVGQLMWDHDVGVIVVVDDETRPVSVVTDRDVAMAAYTQGSPLAHLGVGSCMSKRLVTCRAEADAASVAQLMREHQVRRVPVVDADGKLVGIVGFSDLLTAVTKTTNKAAFKPVDALATQSAILR